MSSKDDVPLTLYGPYLTLMAYTDIEQSAKACPRKKDEQSKNGVTVLFIDIYYLRI